MFLDYYIFMELRPDPKNQDRSFVRFDTKSEMIASRLFTRSTLLTSVMRPLIYLGLADSQVEGPIDLRLTHPLEGAVTREGVTLPSETNNSLSSVKLIHISKVLEWHAKSAAPDKSSNNGSLLASAQLLEMASTINPYIGLRPAEPIESSDPEADPSPPLTGYDC